MVLKTPYNLVKESLKTVSKLFYNQSIPHQIQLDTNKYDLTFKFDSKKQCEINVYVCAKIRTDPKSNKLIITTSSNKP